MPQFEATIKHIHDGVKSFTVAAATKNIEGWEETLGKLDTPGVKTIIRDLESLKKHLHADPIDGPAVHKLIAKLGRETVTFAGKSEGKNAEKAKKLGEALTAAADEHEPARA
nr:hypothetical protein [uncultured Lichenicoccus sp.]